MASSRGLDNNFLIFDLKFAYPEFPVPNCADFILSFFRGRNMLNVKIEEVFQEIPLWQLMNYIAPAS